MKTSSHSSLITLPLVDSKKKAAGLNSEAPKRAEPSAFLSPKQAASFLNVSKSFLDKARCNGSGPGFIRIGARKVLYRTQDLENWMRSRRFENTSQYKKGK